MKVAVILLGDIHSSDGSTVRARRLLELLHQAHETVLIHCSRENNRSIDGMESIQIINLRDKVLDLLLSRPQYSPLKVLYTLTWSPKLTYVLLTHRFDIVYCVWDFMGFIGIYLASKIRKFKTIFDAHSVHSIDVKSAGSPRIIVKLTQFLERFVVKRADFVVALSRNTFELYQRYNTAIDIIPVFFDTGLFVTKGSIRRCSSCSNKVVGLIGSFDTNKRNRYYLDFLYNNIDRFDENISFLVIGQCERRIENDRIIYTGYLNSTMEYVDQLCWLNAVIVPEGISTTGPLNKILEPMACSIPVFTTPEGMVGLYWVEPGTDVLVFDVNELVDKINELVFDDELMAEIGRNSRKVVEQYYSNQVNEQKLFGILEKLLDRDQRNKE